MKKIVKRLYRYLKIWLLLTKNAFLVVLNQRLSLFIFLTGKILRFGFFFVFLTFLLKGTNTLAGFTYQQTIFFFLTYTLVDVVSQFLFREVYRFRPLVVSGGFDLVLSKPFNALARSLLGGADIIDFVTIPPLIILVISFGKLLNPSIFEVLGYLVLLLNGLIIAAAFHIAVLSFGIITLEIDHVVMIYRDVIALGRFPVDIYKGALKFGLTYLIPIALMVTLPAKVLMGLVSWQGVFYTLVGGFIFLFASLKLWNFAVSKYTSASS